MAIEKALLEFPSSSEEAKNAAERMNHRVRVVYETTIDFLLEESKKSGLLGRFKKVSDDDKKYSLWAGEGKINEFLFRSHARITERGRGYKQPLIDAEMIKNTLFVYSEECKPLAERLRDHYKSSTGEAWKVVPCISKFGEVWSNQITLSCFSWTRGRHPSSKFQPIEF